MIYDVAIQQTAVVGPLISFAWLMNDRETNSATSSPRSVLLARIFGQYTGIVQAEPIPLFPTPHKSVRADFCWLRFGSLSEWNVGGTGHRKIFSRRSVHYWYQNVRMNVIYTAMSLLFLYVHLYLRNRRFCLSCLLVFRSTVIQRGKGGGGSSSSRQLTNIYQLLLVLLGFLALFGRLH